MTVATAITCIDGRAHQPIVDFLKRVHGVDVVDVVTAPGVNTLLAAGMSSAHAGFLKESAAVSVTAHHASLLAVAGHHDCAGNPVDEAQQRRHIVAAVRTIDAWGLRVKVIGLWVNDVWGVSEVSQYGDGADV